MPRADEAYLGEQAATQAYEVRTAPRGGQKVMVGGRWLDAAPYVGMRYPGQDVTAMLGDAASILKSPRKGARYVWRRPDDRFTRAMVRRQVLRPVTLEEVDSSNPHANVDTRKLLTQNGPREVVENIGLGLFEMPSQQAEQEFDAWERWYIKGLAELDTKWEDTIDQASSSTMGGGRLTDPSFVVDKTAREQI